MEIARWKYPIQKELKQECIQTKGNTYSESSFQDGSRTRQVYDKKGNIWIESKEIYGNIERRKEKINGGG
jgi:hypothetical protein